MNNLLTLKTAPPLSGAAMQLLWMNNRPRQAYCIIPGAATQAEQPFPAGCYFYTQNSLNFEDYRKNDALWQKQRNYHLDHGDA